MTTATTAESKTLSSMAYSCVIHIALAVVILTLQVQAPPKPEKVEIDILAAPLEPPLALVNNQIENQAPKITETSPAAQTQEESLPPPIAAKPVAEPPLRKALPPTQKIAAPVAHKPSASVAQKIETPVQEDSPVTLPVGEDENLEEVSVAETNPELKNEDLNSDFDEVDQQQTSPEEREKIAALHARLQDEADAEMKEQEEQLLALKKQNELESQALAQQNAERRAQERAALMAAAQEKAAAQAAAQAKKQGELASNQVQGTGGSGHEAQGSDVRSVQDLKQVPGNQNPKYDQEDRLRGRQGEVAFLAYVTKDGVLSSFKLVKSTGHRELDGKTLKAIKGWKFYPGQEGWVEIPYRWSLKGGAQPIGPILRTKKSASM